MAHELDLGVEMDPELQGAGWFVDSQDCELDPFSSILSLSFGGSPEAAFVVQSRVIPPVSHHASSSLFLAKVTLTHSHRGNCN